MTEGIRILPRDQYDQLIGEINRIIKPDEPLNQAKARQIRNVIKRYYPSPIIEPSWLAFYNISPVNLIKHIESGKSYIEIDRIVKSLSS